jgi:hypothetical protein
MTNEYVSEKIKIESADSSISGVDNNRGLNGDTIRNGIDLDGQWKSLTVYRWTTAIGNSHISFGLDNTYLLFTAPEGDWFGEGLYRVEGDTFTLDYPFKMQLWEGLPEATIKWLFNETASTALIYDKEYRDFDVLTCLRLGNKILKNYANESPFGEEYVLGGFQVVKYNERENSVLVLENLRMRKYPETSADPVTLNQWVEVLAETGAYTSNFFISDVVYAGSVNRFDAKTVKMDTIDGITAPWYRISIILGDVFSEHVWVFGGYLKELSPEDREKTGEYYRKYVQTLINGGIVRK